MAQTSLEQYRSQFPALVNKTYFNYGGQGPMAESAMVAIQQSQRYGQEAGPFSMATNRWLDQEAEATRQAIASELQVAPSTISLTEDVTVGCNIALWGLDWQPGDHLLVSDCEHQGVIGAIRELQRRFQLEVSVCPLLDTLNGGDPVEVIATCLRSTTRLVVLSHILWNTGQVLPLEAIVAACRQHQGRYPVRLLVDAAQSVGVLPLNLTDLGADFYAFTGHKWWCGPDGVGGLYVHPAALEELRPTFVGWRGVTLDGLGNPIGWQPDGRRFEIATSATPLLAGLREAIALHHPWGDSSQRYQRICQLSQALWAKLGQIPGVSCLRTSPPESGLVSFQVAGKSHGQIVQALESRQIMVRLLRHPNCIRACVHYFTLEAEIDSLVESLQDLLS